MSNRIEARFYEERGNFTFNVELDIPEQGVTGLYGPSGSGKTTLLRCVAGLERMEGSFLRVGGDIWQDDKHFLPVHKRPIAMIFQDIRLFPHKSVKDNLLYGTKRRKGEHAGISLEDITELLGIGDFLDRKPANLSGGEAQRVAIGRALMSSPELLLMDEPLAAVDVARKGEFMNFLKTLQLAINIPIIMVSHHMEELVKLADHLVLVDQGSIQASGLIGDVLSLPGLSDSYAIKSGSLLEGTICEFDKVYSLTQLQSQIGTLFVPGVIGHYRDRVRLRIHARDISITLTAAQDSSILNIIPVVIAAIDASEGSQVNISLEANGTPLLAQLTRRSCDQLKLAVGDSVYAQVKGIAIE